MKQNKKFMNTNQFAKSKVYDEMLSRGLNVRGYNRGDFLVNEKLIINIKGCNCDNRWHGRINSLDEWDRIDPNRFDYFIGVSFKNDGSDVRYFIFSKNECKKFPDIIWKNDSSLELKNLNLMRDDKDSDVIIESSENKWNKIIEASKL
jgi:hypothetical protein